METKQQQWQLYFLGFFESPKEIDGLWGRRSASATEAFQRACGIGVDGVFGPISQEKSREIIHKIQKRTADYGQGLVPDGLAGPATVAAMKDYQRAFGLCVTGIADEQTRAHMGILGEENVQALEDWWQEIRYFTAGEFACKCGSFCDGFPARMRENAVRIAENARAYFGRPGYVVSGLRCLKHNANVGGVENSQHMYGEAVDLRIEGVSADALLEYVRKQKGVRYAYKINETNVHFDIPKGER